MKISVRITHLLALLSLCVVLPRVLGQIGGAAEKKGSCPLPPNYPKCDGLSKKIDNQCNTDQECPGDEKCCDYGCSLQCKKPLQEKVGSCKDFNNAVCAYARPLPDVCQSDSQCPGTERCCCYDCRRSCSKTVKAGKCPLVVATCKEPAPKPKCKDDADCPGKQKCCSLSGNECMHPEPEKAGYCPIDTDLETHCGYLLPPRCSRDAECGETEKCCLFGCGMQCVKALAERPGVCPKVMAKCKLPFDNPACQSDQDCPKNKKCCNMCGQKCLNSEPDNSGFCPSYKPRKCPAVSSSACGQDSECQADEKCCETGCGRACVKSIKEKSGVCPNISMEESSEDRCDKCKGDKDCPGDEKCCPGAKRRECQKTKKPTEKTGACPPDTVVCKRAEPDQCKNDNECTGDQRCCYFKCGLKCKDTTTVTEHAGSCPVPLFHSKIVCIKNITVINCSKDADCAADEKCCNVPVCQTKCVKAVKVIKTGACPADPIRCSKAAEDLCKNDSECPGDQKCCHYQCGLKCRNAEPVIKTGACPADPIRCIKAAEDLCKNDSECPGDQKCCHFQCGLKCKNAEPVIKTGVCPADTIMCIQAEEDQCKSDIECPGDQKCCYYQCGLKCKDAEPVIKTGVCPADTIRCIRAEKDLCKSDIECTGNQKCCHYRCGLKCKDAEPVTEHAGSCPVPRFHSTIVCIKNITVIECSIDADCAADEKCCKVPVCRTKCVKAVKEKPGECPVPTTICAPVAVPETPKCRQDSDCQGTQKCCTPRCMQECTDVAVPVSEKNGTCPMPPSYPQCDDVRIKPVNQCSTDQQCPGDEKCCNYDCSLQCKKPLQEKVGSCPDFNRSICRYARPAPAQCHSDSQCQGTERCCCHGACRMQCAETVSVKPGTCPRLVASCKLPLPKQQCEDDGDCTGNQKCCSLCGMKCMNPAGNQGFCPVDLETEQQCGYRQPPSCHGDAECQKNEKCCFFGCRVQCVKAVPEKPGMCPAIMAKCRIPFDDPECQTDRDCRGTKKCCQLCGNKCLDSEPDHAGVCPPINPKVMLCPGDNPLSCDHDWNCAADEKCCSSTCGKNCVKALKEKMGVCPKIVTDTNPEEICNKCNSDKDCPGYHRCCSGAKGLECLEPTTLPAEPKKCFLSVQCIRAPCPPIEDECAGPDDVCQANGNVANGCKSTAECNENKAKDPSVSCCSSHLCNVVL